MSITAAIPYLVLAGRADEAISHYHHALGAQVTELVRFADMPTPCPDAFRERVAHAALQIGDAVLMLTDGPGSDAPSAPGTVSVNLMFADTDGARTSFDRLADRGTVTVPLHDAEWGTLFGCVIDRFGVNWMVNGARVEAAVRE